MKNAIKIAAVVVSSSVITLITANVSFADTTCSSTSWYNSHTGTNAANGRPGYCFATPQELNIRLYEFGLCTSAASPSNRDQCTTLFSNSSGTALELSAGISLPLAAGISIAEGIYTHAFVVLSNVTSLKAVIEFASPRTGDGPTTGVYCYTDGRSVNSANSIISCGTDPAAVSASTEVIVLDWPSHSNTLLNYPATMRGETVVTDLYAITSAGELSTNFGDDFALFGSQILNQAITITPNTSNIDIGFSVTGGVTIGFTSGDPTDTYDAIAKTFNGTASAGHAPVDAVFDGLKFIVTAR